MRSSHRTSIAILTGISALACSTSAPTSSEPEELGSVGLELTIADGITLTSLNWSIQDAEQNPVLTSQSSGQRPWSGTGQAPVRFVIGGVRSGGPYTISLSGTSSNQDSCVGTSSTFDMGVGLTRNVQVNVVCRVPGTGIPAVVDSGSLLVEGTVTTAATDPVACPGIAGISVSSSVVAGESTAHLNLASVGTPSEIVWSTTAGAIQSPNASQTDFTCNGYRGQVTVTGTVHGALSCQGQAFTSQSVILSCVDATVEPTPVDRGMPGTPCSANSECMSFSCSNQLCSELAGSCGVLASRGAPPGNYLLDTDGAGPNQMLNVYCQTGSANLPPVGLCQGESGAPPACGSYVGAVGYDFVGVEFGGAIEQAGWLEWQGQAIPGCHDVIELNDRTILSQYPSAGGVPYRFPAQSAAEPFGTGLSDGWGLIELFDRRILVGGNSQVAMIAQDESSQVVLETTASYWPIQTQAGQILLPSRSVNGVLHRTPSGLLVTNTTNAAFLVQNVDSALQLADGTILVAASGNGSNSRIVFFDREMNPRVFSTAPRGMTLNSDGSLTRPDMYGVGRMLQLPNGQILIANTSTNTIMRINSDASYVDTYTLPTGWSSPTGMSLDHRGRLLVIPESTQRVQVLVFPGCSDNRRNGTETDVDCGGGACTARCNAAQRCEANSDCASAVCQNGTCQ